MICPKCKKNISGANKKKHDGVYYHKTCPNRKTRAQLKKESRKKS